MMSLVSIVSLILGLIAYITILYILFKRNKTVFYITLIVGILLLFYIGYIYNNSEELTQVVRCSRKSDCFKEKLTEKDLSCVKNYTDYCKRASIVKELL